MISSRNGVTSSHNPSWNSVLVDPSRSFISLIVPFRFDRASYASHAADLEVGDGFEAVDLFAPDHFDVGDVRSAVIPSTACWRLGDQLEGQLGLRPRDIGHLERRDISISFDFARRQGRLGRTFVVQSSIGVGMVVYRVQLHEQSLIRWTKFLDLCQSGLGRKGILIQTSHGVPLDELTLQILKLLGVTHDSAELEGDVIPHYFVALAGQELTKDLEAALILQLQRLVPVDRPLSWHRELGYPYVFQLAPHAHLLHSINGGGAIVSKLKAGNYVSDSLGPRVRDDYLIVLLLSVLERHALISTSRDLADFSSVEVVDDLDRSVLEFDRIAGDLLATAALARGFSAVADIGMLGAYQRWRRVFSLEDTETSLRSTVGEVNALLQARERRVQRAQAARAIEIQQQAEGRKEAAETKLSALGLAFAPFVVMVGFLGINAREMSSDGLLSGLTVGLLLLSSFLVGLLTMFAYLRTRRRGLQQQR